ncbi:MAG TPA: phospholipid carrier-dependent glycosyltransferase [Anaerolineae bacterium]|nr:phospholipid carrier-dependent glycosyltransferase [Anaerolineae bacterium]
MANQSSPDPSLTAGKRSNLLVAAAGLLVLLTATFFRLWMISQAPPGLSGDEADFGVAALRILSGQYFMVSDVGLLISYGQVPFILLLGRTPLALHLPGALSGSVAAVFVFLFVLEAFRKPWAAFVSGVVFAITFATVHLTRLAFPTVHLPLLQAATYYFFWRGLRRGERWSFGLGGLCLGLTLHAYQSALSLPLAMGLVWLGWLVSNLWRSPAERKTSIHALAVHALCFWGAFLLPALPVVVQAVTSMTYTSTSRYTGQFIFNSAVNGGAPWQMLLDQIRYHLLMYGVLGDPIWRHNLPGRPLFDLPLAILFWLGILISIPRLRKASYAFVAVQLAITLLPGLLAKVDGGAHFLHASAAFVPSVVFPGLAASWIITSLRTRRPWAGAVGMALVALLLLWAGINTYRDYFKVWATEVQATMSFDEIFVDAAAVLNQRAGEVDAWILPMAAATPQTLSSSPITFLYTGDAPVTFIPANDLSAPQDLERSLADVQRMGLITWDAEALKWAEPVYHDAKGLLPFLLARSGRLVQQQAYDGFQVSIYDLDGQSDFALASPQTSPLDVAFAGQVAAVEWNAQEVSPADQPNVWAALRWSALAPLATDLKAAITLRDSDGHLISQQDLLLLDSKARPSSRWDAGDGGWTGALLAIPPGTPPGEYSLEAAVYDAATQEKLPVSQGDASSARTAVVGKVDINAQTAGMAPTPQVALDGESSAPELTGSRLAGYDPLPQQTRPGDTLTLTSYWQALQDAPSALAIQIQVVDPASGAIVQSQAVALGGDYPTTRWSAGQWVADRSNVTLKRDLPSGVYAMQLAIDGGDQATQRVELGDIDILGWPRQFEPPAVAQPTQVRFGDEMQLVGYTVGPAVAGQPLVVTLCWQALAEMDTSYVTFVHLLDAGGALQSQNDAIPGQGAYPTTGWLPGEYVCSEHALPLAAGLPAGTYAVSVGVYDPLFERRLPAAIDGELAGDEVHLTTVGIKP